MIGPMKIGLFRFSTTAAISARTYAKFQEKYKANIDAFKKKVGENEIKSDQIKRSTQKVYEHPIYCSHRRMTTGGTKDLQLLGEMIGSEQVSPHYENFGMARQEALIFWAGLFILRYISVTPDFHFFANAASTGWIFTFGYLYFWTEGKRSFAMPILNRFYRKISSMEMENLETYYSENVEGKVRELMNIAKSQIEYKLVHNDYLSIRNDTILNFLINEQISLKNHLNERALNILKQAQSLEEINHSKIISSVMTETLNSIDKAYNENKEVIEKEMFSLALEGVANGVMDYKKDPILPHVVKTIQKTVEKFNSISEEEQNKLVKLTQDQISEIRNSDTRARDEYLQNEPKIEGSLKSNEVISKILERWGK